MKDLFDKTFFKLLLGFAAILLVSLIAISLSAQYKNGVDGSSQIAKPASVGR